MKRSKFSEAQLAFVLIRRTMARRLERCAARPGISRATYNNGRKKYAGLMPSEMKRLRQLKEENAKLKRLHGGTNPGAPSGNRNARKHGGYSAKAKSAARYVKEIARLVRETP